MKIKKALFNKSSLLESENYFSDKYILFNKINPHFEIPSFNERITKHDEKDFEKLIPEKGTLKNIDNTVEYENPTYYHSQYNSHKKIKLTEINCKLNLKYYEFLKDVQYSKLPVEIFIDEKLENSPVYVFYNGTNNIMAIFMPFDK